MTVAGSWGKQIATSGKWAAITPSDTTTFDECRAIYVGTAGTVRGVSPAGDTVDFVCTAGSYHPLRMVKVLLTGTTAGDLVALY